MQGSVMEKMQRPLPAPSIAADSYRPGSMDRMADRNKTELNPMSFHMSAPTTMIRKRLLSVRVMGESPLPFSRKLMPVSGLKKVMQKTDTTTQDRKCGM